MKVINVALLDEQRGAHKVEKGLKRRTRERQSLRQKSSNSFFSWIIYRIFHFDFNRKIGERKGRKKNVEKFVSQFFSISVSSFWGSWDRISAADNFWWEKFATIFQLDHRCRDGRRNRKWNLIPWREKREKSKKIFHWISFEHKIQLS